MDMPKPRFASSISQSANDVFSSFSTLKKELRSKVTLLFSLTRSVDFFMLSPRNKQARIYTGFHRFTEIGQIFRIINTFLVKKNFLS